MEKVVYSVYDVQADMYDTPMTFENERFAVASIRRNVRDMFIKKEVTYDSLRDRQLRLIGVFDTQNGEFKQHDGEAFNVTLSNFVCDLMASDDYEV